MESHNQEKQPDKTESKPIESKKELWKSVPKTFLAEAIYRANDQTRSNIAANISEIYEERTGEELFPQQQGEEKVQTEQ